MAGLWDSVVATLAGVLDPHGPPRAAQAVSYAPGDISVYFFLQLAVILVVARAVGWAGRRWFGQPQVVGEMVAGVVLGPSLLGWLAPGLQAAIFPPATRDVLYAGAQLGVGLYMFLVGTTLRLDLFRQRARSAVAVSLAGVAAPFAVAALMTPLLLAVPGLFLPGVGQGPATLFFGACIALTAFPMLARIITERGLADTPLGTLSLAAGAFDDVVSWCVLALVLAAFGGGPGVAVLAIAGGLLYAVFLALFGRRLLRPLGEAVERTGTMSPTVLAITLALFCLSAFLMDAIGIHAIFGGFALGVVMPRGRFAVELKRQLEPVVVVLLLPMFFTYSGLNTQFGTVATLPLLLLALAILAASIVAKAGACYLAARVAGEDARTALGIGALMNARGLMELIIINIGLQKGIIGPTLFAMLVLMAIVTTVMTTPLFNLAWGRARPAAEPARAP